MLNLMIFILLMGETFGNEKSNTNITESFTAQIPTPNLFFLFSSVKTDFNNKEKVNKDPGNGNRGNGKENGNGNGNGNKNKNNNGNEKPCDVPANECEFYFIVYLDLENFLYFLAKIKKVMWKKKKF